MTSMVLDASAMLAVLLREPGAERVKAVLGSAAISAVNLIEVIGHFARRGASETRIRSMLGEFSLDRVAFDEDLAYAAGMMLPLTRSAGLSLGDRACLALAQRLRVPALTADRQWAQIADAVGVEVEVIR